MFELPTGVLKLTGVKSPRIRPKSFPYPTTGSWADLRARTAVAEFGSPILEEDKTIMASVKPLKSLWQTLARDAA